MEFSELFRLLVTVGYGLGVVAMGYLNSRINRVEDSLREDMKRGDEGFQRTLDEIRRQQTDILSRLFTRDDARLLFDTLTRKNNGD
jgi:hypothetical protein